MTFMPRKVYVFPALLPLLIALLFTLAIAFPADAITINVLQDVTIVTPSSGHKITLVAGSTFDSMKIPAGGDSINFTVEADQKVTLRSGTKRVLNSSAGAFSCGSTSSELVVKSADAPAGSFGVEVVNSACTGGGGGGGGGTTTTTTTTTTTPAPTTTITTTTTTQVAPVAGGVTSPAPTVLAPSAPSIAGIERFRVELGLGDRGDAVTDLQLFLAQDPAIYPEALVTGYYGPLTTAAVKQFQKKYGISQVGRVGPQTLAVMNAVLDKEKVVAPAAVTTAPAAGDDAAARAALQAQIQQVQAQIAALQSAIQARLVGQAAPVPTPTPEPTPAPTTQDSTAAQRAAIQQQITEALAKVAEITAQIQAAQ